MYSYTTRKAIYLVQGRCENDSLSIDQEITPQSVKRTSFQHFLGMQVWQSVYRCYTVTYSKNMCRNAAHASDMLLVARVHTITSVHPSTTHKVSVYTTVVTGDAVTQPDYIICEPETTGYADFERVFSKSQHRTHGIYVPGRVDVIIWNGTGIDFRAFCRIHVIQRHRRVVCSRVYFLAAD